MSRRKKRQDEAAENAASPVPNSENPNPKSPPTGVRVVDGRKVRVTVRNAAGDTQVEYLT